MISIAERRLINANAAARFLSISRASLYRLVSKNQVPSVKIGGRRLFDLTELNKFVDQLRTDPIDNRN